MTDDEWRYRIHELLVNIGDPAYCRGCEAPIYWVRHKTGTLAPYTVDGQNHFIDCPNAKEFRRGKIK